MMNLRDWKKQRLLIEMSQMFRKDFSKRARFYIVFLFAEFLITSPLPDEIGIIILAGLTHIGIKKIALISFILHFIEILIMLMI